MDQTQAASSTAEVDIFNGQQPTFEEYSQYRESGKVPERFKPAEAAKTDAPEETAEVTEIAPESDPDKQQEPPQKVSEAQKRILQLVAEKKELQRKLDEAAKPGVSTEPPPVQQSSAQPQAPQFTRPKPKPEGMNQDGKPYETYEDYVEDLAKWSGEQQLAQYQRQQAEEQARSAVRKRMDEARARYADADTVIIPVDKALGKAEIPQVIKQVLGDSEVYTDICYVIGSDPDELQKFISLAQTNPRAAIARVFEYENGIKAERAKAQGASESENGTAPVKKQTQAPKPPDPVTGASSRAFDVSDESLSPEEWARKRTEQINRRNRG